MFTVSLISLPSETLRRLADDGTHQPSGGGDAKERRAGLAVVGVAALLAIVFALVLGA